MSTQLEEALGRDRDSAIAVIETITSTSTLDEIKRASRVTRTLRRRAEKLATEPGEAIEWLIETLYEHPSWGPFREIRRVIWRSQEHVKKRHRETSRRWYQEVGSAKRKTLEARRELAAQRKTQRAKKLERDATQSALSESSRTISMP